jgi:hypothetical protein
VLNNSCRRDEDARLDEALELEREALRRMHELRDKLTEDDPYRAILERHVGRLESAVNQLDTLASGPLAWLTQMNGSDGDP